MHILFVASGNRGSISPFVIEQGNSLDKDNIELDYFLIKGKGIIGYTRNLKILKDKIREFNPDLIHAHFGLSGAVACLQWLKPKVVTFHGTDVSNKKNNLISSVVALFADHIITVNKWMPEKLLFKRKHSISIIPCGVELDTFYPLNKSEARKINGFIETDKIIVFASAFTNPVKNYQLAKQAVNMIREKGRDIKLIELANKTRDDVNTLLNAADLLLVTSFTEGSPQVVKEAMACNCPIVSTDVGDVKEIINGTDGCYITTYDAEDVAEKINSALGFEGRTNGRIKIQQYDNKLIAEKIIEVYKMVLNKRS